MNGNTFKAPWGKTLLWVSVLSGLLLLAVAVPLLAEAAPKEVRGLTALPLLILAGAALFVIRSYTIDPNELLIQRLLWATRLPLAGLKSAEVVPQAMRGSIRLFGNGGLFSITGLYRSRALGNYRAFVTNLKDTVVLRFEKRTVVISPENPERFVAEISSFVNRNS
jgi:hypothetical protein